MTLPAAGWFPDPREAARLRWWDGRAWGDATRPLPSRPVEAVRPIVVTPTGPAFSVLTSPVETRTWAYGAGAAQRFCALTCLAVVLAVVSVALNPWGACSSLRSHGAPDRGGRGVRRSAGGAQRLGLRPAGRPRDEHSRATTCATRMPARMRDRVTPARAARAGRACVRVRWDRRCHRCVQGSGCAVPSRWSRWRWWTQDSWPSRRSPSPPLPSRGKVGDIG